MFRSVSIARVAILCGWVQLMGNVDAATAPEINPGAWKLLPNAQVRSAGIFLSEIAECPATPLPHIRIGSAPNIGQTVVYSRAQVMELLRQTTPELVTSNWVGATQIRVSRKMRSVDESEIRQALVSTLQRDFVKDRGELELRFTKPWTPTSIADEEYTLNIVDLPSAGVTPNFVARFELRAGQSLLGNWQVPVQARIWREVWVAGSAVQRGQLLTQADLVRERRDVLVIRDAIANITREESGVEISENLPVGAPLTMKSLRLRPIVSRGKVVDAIVQDGSLTITVKAEVLEDGLPGQSVRVRNLKSRREFRGKVQNEETIVVAL